MGKTHALFWLSVCFQIRTQFFFQFPQRYLFCPVLEVKYKDDFVIEEINAVYKPVDQTLSALQIVGIDVAETGDPKCDMLFCDFGALQFFAHYGDLQFLLCRFQFVEPLFCRFVEDALLNGVEHILDEGLRFRKPRSELREKGVLLRQQVEDHIGNIFDERVVHDDLHRISDDKILDPILFDGFFITALVSLCVGALIVVVDRFPLARSRFARHERTAFPAP